MNDKKSFHITSEFDDKNVDGVLNYQKKVKKASWGKWGAVALCFWAGGVSAWTAYNTHLTAAPLEKISIPEFSGSEMGFEGYMYYDASELRNDNPWNENTEITTLPVYLNKAYDSSGAGFPKGLNENEMWSILESSASELGVEIISTEVTTEQVPIKGDDGDPIPTVIHAETDNGAIHVQADGEVIYSPPDDGLALPSEYSFTNSKTTSDEAQKAIVFLSGLYGDLLNMEKPTAVTWGDYDIDGEYHRRYAVYDSSGNAVEDILNYNLCSVSFSPNEAGSLFQIRIDNKLAVAEKIGDYPIVSLSEAEQRLLAGNYQTSVPYAMPGEEYVTSVELVYRSGYFMELLIPYYRFYVLLPDMKQDNGLQTYGAYYVPAITDEYISNMPIYDGHFN